MFNINRNFKTEYSLGFAFYNSDVVLMLKNRPEDQRGLFNGVGGKKESCENPQQCMVREFYEETDVITNGIQWIYRGVLNDPYMADVGVHVFYTHLTDYQYSQLIEHNWNKSLKDEPIYPINIYDEIFLLNSAHKLLYNIQDIILELSAICLIANPVYNFRKYIHQNKPFTPRIKQCSIYW